MMPAVPCEVNGKFLEGIMPVFVIFYDLEFQLHVHEPSSDPVELDLFVPDPHILAAHLIPSHREKFPDRPLVKAAVLNG